jgi:hypothetical protein
MGIENWGTSHPVTLAFILALVASFGLSPFSNDIRALYAAVPRGVRTVRRVSLILALQRAHLQLADPTTVIRQLIIRRSIVFLYGAVNLYLLLRDTNKKFDIQFHAPLSSADKALANSRSILDFLVVMWVVAGAMSMASLFTVWQYRRPLDQAKKLALKLGPLTKEEDRMARLRE